MRVLAVIPTLGYGGAERLLVTLLPHFVKMGVDVQVCVLNSPVDLAPEIRQHDISVVNLNLSHRWSIIEAVYKISKQVKIFKPNIIWAHLYFGILYSRLTSFFFSNVRVVSTLHYHISSDSAKKGLWYSFRNWMLNKSKVLDFKTVAVSKSVKRDYERFFKWSSIDVIFNAINFQSLKNAIYKTDFSILKEKYNISEVNTTVLLPGRLHKGKGHKYLIEAIFFLKNEYNLMPQIIIVGDGESRTEIVKMINELDLNDQFILTGNLKQTELFKIMKAVDFIVIPSLYEAFGIVAIEAMYLEKPLVVTKIDGLREITSHNIDAIQIPVKNAEAIANSIIKLIKNKEYAETLAKNAKVTASIYNANIIANQWSNIFKENGSKK